MSGKTIIKAMLFLSVILMPVLCGTAEAHVAHAEMPVFVTVVQSPYNSPHQIISQTAPQVTAAQYLKQNISQSQNLAKQPLPQGHFYYADEESSAIR